ncbi:hypothetical protein BZA05DRAFT_409724 [Tricharina praecox]|uniref:uncharacterized protein n=1 Tax=Tricharina praecox TaxID=43433 RepID=UPI0022206539|nr:uncharacterized protein BZA05DRAFT_409724 [Tricharina praecox]KAI5844318.1 hypothetical protein BZA05DRAFT_409724 [Tricharina praecox]
MSQWLRGRGRGLTAGWLGVLAGGPARGVLMSALVSSVMEEVEDIRVIYLDIFDVSGEASVNRFRTVQPLRYFEADRSRTIQPRWCFVTVGPSNGGQIV